MRPTMSAIGIVFVGILAAYCLRMLVEGSYELDEKPTKCLLHTVVRSGDMENLSLLLASGADVDCRDAKGYPPLYAAAETGNVGMMKSLIASGAALEAEVGSNRLLHCAVVRKDRTAVKALLKVGADVNSRTMDRHRSTALHLAVSDNNVDIISILIKYGAALDVEDGTGRTPLMEAAVQGYLGSTKTLLEGGADVNEKGYRGRTALHEAASWGQLEVAKALVDSGAEIDATDEDGRTPLHLAVMGVSD